MDKTITVDTADLQVSADCAVTLVTYALGSCISVMAYDREKKIGGMIHCMLPFSSTSPEKAAVKPAMFADTGLPALFDKMYMLGAAKEDLTIKVAGGGSLYDDNGLFNIGDRNYNVIKKLLLDSGMIINSQDVGGNSSRTAKLRLLDGKCTIQTKGDEVEL